MFRELGIEPGPAAFAAHYGGLLRGLVIDQEDQSQAANLASERLTVLVTDTVMRSPSDRRRLAVEVLGMVEALIQSGSGA